MPQTVREISGNSTVQVVTLYLFVFPDAVPGEWLPCIVYLSVFPDVSLLLLFVDDVSSYILTVSVVTDELILFVRNIGFYPRDAMLVRVFAIATCPSVHLSVRRTPVLCLAERKQDREMYTI